MPYTTKNNSNLTASTKTNNLLSGDINEFIGYNAIVNVFAVSSASSVNVTLMADSDVAIDDKEIVTIGTTLDKSQHLLDSFAVAAGTRLALFLRETAGVATTDVLIGVEVLPM